jgi:adenylate kinase
MKYGHIIFELKNEEEKKKKKHKILKLAQEDKSRDIRIVNAKKIDEEVLTLAFPKP